MKVSKIPAAPRLDLILKHLRTVRKLDEYIHDGELQKDIRGLRNHLRQTLNRYLPETWEHLEDRKGGLCSSPIRKMWAVVKDKALALEIFWPMPVGDYPDNEVSVGLSVPATWKKRDHFLKVLKAPHGFDHINNYADKDLWDENASIWKYVRYENYLRADNTFNWPRFIRAIRDGAICVTGLETQIDSILKQLR